MVNNLKAECSICNWYPIFAKNALEAAVLPIPNEIHKYLEHDAFLLPVEASSSNVSSNLEWTDGSPVNSESSEESENQPTFPEFSKKIQDVIDEYGAIFLKSNWRSPSDATWVAPTKTLKCTTLEEVYLLLKSSDRISGDLNAVENWNNNEEAPRPCLVLKRWREINPCTEFRCFVVNKELIGEQDSCNHGICQRDASQYHHHIESEKYNIQRDITSLFNERIKERFKLNDYSFDVIRYKKDKVKILDFGPLDEFVTKGTLFTLEELRDPVNDTPEFRFIAEDMGIQPTTNNHFCVPREINDFFRSANGQMSMMDILQREVESQNEA